MWGNMTLTPICLVFSSGSDKTPGYKIWIFSFAKSLTQDEFKRGEVGYVTLKVKALQAERSVRQGASAELYLLDSGKTAIAKLNYK